MKRIKCMIIDDEPAAVAYLKNMLADRKELLLVGTSTSPEKGIEMIRHYGVELLFLDLHMNGMHGVEVIRAIDKRIHVICCTGHNQYGPDLFELGVRDYLLKPFNKTRIDVAVDRVLAKMELEALKPEKYLLPALTLDHVISVRESGSPRWVQLCLLDIEVMEAVDKQVKLTCTDGELMIDYSLGELEKMLPANHFMRVHRSFMVALSRIASFSVSEGIHLRGSSRKTAVSVGETYLSHVRNYLAKKELNKL